MKVGEWFCDTYLLLSLIKFHTFTCEHKVLKFLLLEFWTSSLSSMSSAGQKCDSI